MRLVSASFAAASLIVASLPTMAFELQGYRSGMSLAEVTEIAKHSGWEIVPVGFVLSSGNGSYGLRRPLPSGALTFGIDFSFCNDHLMLLGETIQGGFDAFARTLEAYTKRFGQGSISSRSENGPNGTLSEITVEWLDPGHDRHRVSMFALQGRQTVAVSMFSPEVARPCRQTD
ncbi:hypothetical protein MAE02_62530 [Microvirga aerophila]|uniref:DUF1579 domain-containing protein n=1 Tax=Microvirga aerophila TaxID=670291 RepID=A0A512C3D7_9HYPH|nr:hypothetical protein MAE02_62530 [Microvirga aerophila]